MPLREWLRPPHIPLLALFLLTLASASSLGWFGWRLLQQARAVEAQRAQERLEQSADGIAERMRGAVAATQESLALWSANPARADVSQQGLLLVSQGAARAANDYQAENRPTRMSRMSDVLFLSMTDFETRDK